MYNTSEFKTIIPAGKIYLKYLYKPSFINRYRFNKLNDNAREIGILNIVQLGYVNVDDNNNIEINRLGMEVADQIIDEDKRYYLPTVLSIMSLAAALLTLFLTIIQMIFKTLV